MTATCLTFICVDKVGFHLPVSLVPWLYAGTFIVSLLQFFLWRNAQIKRSGN